MKIVIVVVVAFVMMVFIGGRSWGQNLVPNPSFEDTLACPDWPLPNIGSAAHWSSYGNTSDYFNSCANTQQQLFGVPSNFAGSQNAHLGVAYAGLLTWYVTVVCCMREYIGVELIEPLTIGNKYYVSCYVSNGDSSGEAPSSTNNLGFRFSTVEYFNVNGSMVPTDNFSHVHEDTLVANKTGWSKVAGSFIADSAYQYLAIGNFYNDEYTLIDTVGYPYGTGAYYYVDDVSVFPDTATGIKMPTTNFTIQISPNPVQNLLTINLPSPSSTATIAVYDVAGRKIVLLTTFTNNKAELSTTTLPNGIYLLQIINNKTGVSEVGKFVKEE